MRNKILMPVAAAFVLTSVAAPYAASARSVLLPPSVTTSVRVSASLLTALAALAEPMAATRATAATRDFHMLQYRCSHRLCCISQGIFAFAWELI